MAAVVPHHLNEDGGPVILGSTLTVTIFALVTMTARLLVKWKMIRNVGWDVRSPEQFDGCVVGQAVIIPEVYFGAGRHIDHIAPAGFQVAFKLNFVTQPIYLVALCLVKLSIGYFLLRLAVTTFYRRAIIFIMTFMGLYTTACFLTIILQCTNLAVLWDPTVKGTCWGVTTLKALSYTNVALNITTDLLFAVIIPIPMLWSVQMNFRQKMSLIGILGLGVLATAGALVKISYLPNYGKTGDWLWDSRNITIWTVIECNIGIIAGNLPCLKPLFRTILSSTYGRGSCNTTPKYISRPYGSGTRNHHSAKAYNSLVSSKGPDDDFRPYGGGDEAVMMTNITAKERHGSNGSVRDESSRKNSADSVAWPDDNPAGKMGGIMKTTEVNISKTERQAEDFDDPMRQESKDAHIV
ncbi:uncharacterized protein BDR25DRAFT_375408 [Lindgomyces ingoldianus]|uniref:Uncharacterized protein n=1 Tax=Lindgomyces ingoldianus TaxID=673940 RepID=A0ACB6RAZ5_9PLEO|nr:uncharacterized protein BDR25DRAFT_375408 [Lindgomyces ingoldianus]KAF2476493.1 hypothetical protein BDR25DRAFT_375408 [Lindgomyces ingoldianus]